MSEAVQHGAAAQAPPRILVAEREADAARALCSELTAMGYAICGCVDTGAAALACAPEARADVLITNVVLNGDMDGISMAEHFLRGQHIPVLFLTAFTDTATLERALRAHPAAYLTKPYDARELRAQIEVALFQGQLQQRLSASEQWFHAILRCVADGVVATDPNGRVRFLNPVAEQLLGWPADEAVGRDIDAIVRLADGGQALPSPVREALARDTVITLARPCTLFDRAGKGLLIDDTAAPIHGEHGGLLGAVLVFHDARARVDAERSLQQSEQRFRDAFDLAPAGMAMVCTDGRFQRVNGALCRLLGHGADALLGRSEAEFGIDTPCAQQAGALQRLQAGGAPGVPFEKRYRRADGAAVWALVSVSLLNQHTQPPCFLY